MTAFCCKAEQYVYMYIYNKKYQFNSLTGFVFAGYIMLYDENEIFETANVECVKQGGHLAMITPAELHSEVLISKLTG